MLNRADEARLRAWPSVRADRVFAAARTTLGVLGASVAAFIAALFLLPVTLALPVVGLGLVLAAATLALTALASPDDVGSARVVFWDVAGALGVIGLAATGVSESETLLAYLGRER